MQDTHLIEYEIIESLASVCRNLVLAGDFDQTIYEWRGSTPKLITDRFLRDFPNVRKMTFSENHRSTKNLIRVSQRIVSSFGGTPAQPSNTAMEGPPIIVHGAQHEAGEAHWIAQQIKNLHSQGVPYEKIGILCRSNNRASLISQGLKGENVPHLTVETYEFFRRQEVKDLVARLRFLLNPEDSVSLRRMLKRPTSGIGGGTIAKVESLAETGIRLTDLASMDCLNMGEPFAKLIWAFEQGTIVILDCETTGIDFLNDEIIEIAAYKIHKGRHTETFHSYLKVEKEVGASFNVHGLTDEFLKVQGIDPRTVLVEFAEFIDSHLVLGHNIKFDLNMLENAFHKHRLKPPQFEYCDTLSIAKRFLHADSYGLEQLSVQFDFRNQPSHRAEADVAATFELLCNLMPALIKTEFKRRAVVSKLRPLFEEQAEKVSKWRQLMLRLRPAELIRVIMEDSGLASYYGQESRHLENLQELYLTAARLDDLNLLPQQALMELVEFAALARNVDRLERSGKVMCITVHQAKGLEFDIVFLAGMSAYEFPNYGALKLGREAEERRLFYVGVTRAKTRLLVSYFRSKNGRFRSASEYLEYLQVGV